MSKVTTGRLLREMIDLNSLTYYPDPYYKCIQFSSYDRRSVAADALAAAHDLLIEAKPGAVALHYRSRPDLGPLVRRTVDEAVIPGLRALHGNMVSEIARADIDKGTALAALMARPPFAGRVPVMIGDDVTDEDGFRRAQAMGGAGLHIGAGPTVALWRLPTIDAAHDWLARTLTGTPARTEGAAP